MLARRLFGIGFPLTLAIQLFFMSSAIAQYPLVSINRDGTFTFENKDKAQETIRIEPGTSVRTRARLKLDDLADNATVYVDGNYTFGSDTIDSHGDCAMLGKLV